MSAHNIHFQDKMRDLELSQIYKYLLLWIKKLRTKELVRNIRVKRAIGVRAIGVSVYIQYNTIQYNTIQ